MKSPRYYYSSDTGYTDCCGPYNSEAEAKQACDDENEDDEEYVILKEVARSTERKRVTKWEKVS